MKRSRTLLAGMMILSMAGCGSGIRDTWWDDVKAAHKAKDWELSISILAKAKSESLGDPPWSKEERDRIDVMQEICKSCLKNPASDVCEEGFLDAYTSPRP